MFGSPVQVCKYSNFIDADQIVKTVLENLVIIPNSKISEENKHLSGFNIANHANISIILTGGEGKLCTKSTKTFGMDVAKGKWHH